MSEIREIVTKAVIAKGRKCFRINQTIPVDNDAGNVLGCWVINHSNDCVLGTNCVNVDGTFDVNVWYANTENTSTKIASATINYKENIKIREISCDSINRNSEVQIKVLQQPTCTNACITQNGIELEIVFELLVEVIGETKIMVTVFTCQESFEPIDDFENEINEDFLRDE
jgi:spore coat protein E